MNRLTKFLVTFALPVITAIIIVVPITMSVTKAAIADSNRTSAVNACLAANKAHDGVEKLIAQLRASASSSRALTPAEKASREAGYTALAGDFPELDCTANPIIFKP